MRTQRILALVALGTLGLAACGSKADEATDTTAERATTEAPATEAPTTKAPTTPAPTPAPTTQAPTTTAAPVKPTAADYSIALVTTRQQCFGSAGCNVTVVPELSVIGPAGLNKAVSITYQISGDTSGPVIQTIDVTADGKYSQNDVNITTPSADVAPTETITLVR